MTCLPKWQQILPLETGEQIMYSYDTMQRVKSEIRKMNAEVIGEAEYSYSDAGCLTNIIYTGNAYPTKTTSLKWNSQYQLTSVSTNGVVAESYTYDSLGRRICYIKNSPVLNSPVTNHCIYNGNQVIADVDNAGNLLRTYTYGPGTSGSALDNRHLGVYITN